MTNIPSLTPDAVDKAAVATSLRTTTLLKLIENLHSGEFVDALMTSLAKDNSSHHTLVLHCRRHHAVSIRQLANSSANCPDVSRLIQGDRADAHDWLFDVISKFDSDRAYFLEELKKSALNNTLFFKRYLKLQQVADLVCHFVCLDNNNYIIISCARLKPASSFSAATLAEYRELSVHLCALAKSHWQAESFRNTDQRKPAVHPQIERALSVFAGHILTRREQDVVGLILKGYSSKSIALELNISTKTEKVHRRNIYAKLRVRSQSALFALFLDHLSTFLHDMSIPAAAQLPV